MAQIDSSIYSQMQAPDILGNVQRGLKLRDMIDQKKKLDEQDAKLKGVDDAYKAGVIQNPDGTVSVDKNKTLGALAKVGGREFMDAQDKFTAQGQAQAKAQMEKQMQQLDLTARLIGGSTDQSNYDNALVQGAKFGLDVSQMPKAYDAGLIRQYQLQALSAKEQLDQKWKQMDFDKDVSFKEQENKFKQSDLDIKKDSQKIDWAKLANEKEKTKIDRTKAANENKNIPQNVYAAATYGKRVEDANNQMDALMKDGYDPTSYSQSLINKVTPEAMKGDKPKLMDQAQRNFINAVLRRESGSAIASTEFDSARMQYFPQVGDSKEVLEQKTRNRDVALSGLKSEGGKAWNQVEKNLTTQTQDKNTRVVNGQIYRKVEGGWLPAQK